MAKLKNVEETQETNGVISGDNFYLSGFDRSRIIARTEDILFQPLSPSGKNVLQWAKSIHNRKLLKWQKEHEQDLDGPEDLTYLKGLDPVEWKEQDHYRVIGLQHLRKRATEDDIKRSYRLRVLKHHPDKRQGAGEKVDPEGDYFACIVKAYEILSNPSKRRSYDSVDPFFDDYTPSPKSIKCPEEFFTVFGKWFSLNSRWSTVQPVPLLGNMFATRSQVDDFYQFWFDFESWRDYSYLDEEDKEKGQCREERRWIEKQNKVQRLKMKKEEMARIRSVVEAAWDIDPRIALFKERDRREKIDKKNARRKAAQKEKDDLDKVRLEEERKVREEVEQKQAEEREKEAAAKKIKEGEKKALKKERTTFRKLCKSNGYYGSDEKSSVENMASMEGICEVLVVDELAKLNESLAQLKFEEGKVEFEKAVEKAKERMAEEKMKSFEAFEKEAGNLGGSQKKKLADDEQWSHDEIQLLIKAVNLFPAGTVQRWEVVANFINQHYSDKRQGRKRRTAKEVLAKAKDFNSSDFSKSSLKEETNQKAYELFEKNLKNPSKAVVVESEETKREGDAVVGGDGDASKVWTAGEQKVFEQALKTYPSTVGGDRWEKIAECVPGRSKKECIARYKELAALVKAKKLAQTTVK